MAPFNGKFIPLHKRKAHNAGVRQRNAARRARKATPSFAKKVMKIVQKTEEVKCTQYAFTIGYTNYSSATPTLINVSPNATTMVIPQGVGQGDRIGNKIRVKKVTLKCILVPEQYSASLNPNPCPHEVRMTLISNKKTVQTTPVMASLIQNGNTSVAPSGNLADMIDSYNTDLNMIHRDRKFKVGLSSYGGTGGSAAVQYYNNNDFKVNHKFTWDITKAYPKTLNYNDTDVSPNERYVYLMAMSADALNFNTATTPVMGTMQCFVELKYTDA